MNLRTSSNQRKRQKFYPRPSNVSYLDSICDNTEKNFLSQGQLFNHNVPSQTQLESHIEKCLSYLNQSIGANIEAQQHLIDLLKCKTTVKAKKIKQIYKTLSQNKANQICFQKGRDNIFKLHYDYSSQQSIFRLYVRLIEKFTTKIAYYLFNSHHLSFMALSILDYIKKIEICVRRIHNLKDLSFLFDMVNKVFEQSKTLQNKIYQTFIDKGYLMSLEQYFQINGIDIEHRQYFSPIQNAEQSQLQQITNKVQNPSNNNSNKNANISNDYTSKKKIDKNQIVQKIWTIKKKQQKSVNFHPKTNEVNQQIQLKLGNILELLINQNKQFKINETLIQNDESESQKQIGQKNSNYIGSIKSRFSKKGSVGKLTKQNISSFLTKDFQKILKTLALNKVDFKSQRGIKCIQSQVYQLISNQNPDRLILRKGLRKKQTKRLTWEKGGSMKSLLKQSYRRQTFMFGQQLSDQFFANHNLSDNSCSLLRKNQHNSSSKPNYSIRDMQFPQAVSSWANNQIIRQEEGIRLQKKKTNQQWWIQRKQNINSTKSSHFKQMIQKIKKQRKRTSPPGKIFSNNIIQGQLQGRRNFNSLNYSLDSNNPLSNFIFLNNLAKDIKQYPNIVFDNNLLKDQNKIESQENINNLNKAIFSFNYEAQLKKGDNEKNHPRQSSGRIMTQGSYLTPKKEILNKLTQQKKSSAYQKSKKIQKTDVQQKKNILNTQSKQEVNTSQLKNADQLYLKKEEFNKKRLQFLEKDYYYIQNKNSNKQLEKCKKMRKQNSFTVSKNKNSSKNRLTDINFYRVYDSRRRVFLR